MARDPFKVVRGGKRVGAGRKILKSPLKRRVRNTRDRKKRESEWRKLATLDDKIERFPESDRLNDEYKSLIAKRATLADRLHRLERFNISDGTPSALSSDSDESNDETATRRDARKRRAESVHTLLEKRRKANDAAGVSTSDPGFVLNISGRLYVAPSGEVDGTVAAQAGNSRLSPSLELIGVEPTESLAESRSQPSSPRANHPYIEVALVLDENGHMIAPPSPALVQEDAAPVIDGLLTPAESIVDPFPSPATNQQTQEVPESVDWASVNQNDVASPPHQSTDPSLPSRNLFNDGTEPEAEDCSMSTEVESSNIEQVESSNVFKRAQLTAKQYREELFVKRTKSLGYLMYTPEEAIACQISIKMSSNLSDATFLKELNFLANGLQDPNHGLPATRYKSTNHLTKILDITPKYVVYCIKCLEICGQTFKTPRKAYCRECKIHIDEQLAEGKGFFLILPIKDQIEGFLRDKNFQLVLRKFALMEECHLNGTLHSGLVKGGHFDLSLGIDAAQMHNFPGKSILPAVLFFNNVPVSWQLRYPILAALWTGPTNSKPPRSVFLKYMQKELRELGTFNSIFWKDDLGNEHESLTFLTTVITDAPEKAEMLNQVSCTGYFSCPFCTIKGEILTVAEYPHVFKENPFRRTIGESSVGGVRFPDTTTEYPWRDSAERVQTGKTVAEERRQRNSEYTEDGIKGLPVLRHLPRFLETDSHVPDTLHLIAEGVFKDMMIVMTRGEKGLGNTFLSATQSWSTFHELQDSLTRVSESDRNCSYVQKFAEWKAYDSVQFLLHDVALLCSDDNLFTNDKVYDCLCCLSNIVYLSMYGRMGPEIIDQVKNESRKFLKKFKKLFTEEFFTIKVHELIHLFIILQLHGCAAYTDAFNLERFISKCKKLLTTNKLQMRQISRNFLLKHQSPFLKEMEGFQDCAKKTLKENGLFDEEFFSKFSDVVKKTSEEQGIQEDVREVIDDFLFRALRVDPKTASMTRVDQMTRKSFILETEHVKHRINTSVNDSYIQLNKGEMFGQITEIVHLPDKDRFIFVLKKFNRIYPSYDTGIEIKYPMNQFPFERPLQPQYHAFLLTGSLFIQKAQTSRTSYYHSDGRRVTIFSVQPNEWFRY